MFTFNSIGKGSQERILSGGMAIGFVDEEDESLHKGEDILEEDMLEIQG